MICSEAFGRISLEHTGKKQKEKEKKKKYRCRKIDDGFFFLLPAQCCGGNPVLFSQSCRNMFGVPVQVRSSYECWLDPPPGDGGGNGSP